MINTDYSRRQAAVGETVERLNTERAAMGLPPDYIVKLNPDGVPSVAVAGGAPENTAERVRLNASSTIKRERLKRERL